MSTRPNNRKPVKRKIPQPAAAAVKAGRQRKTSQKGQAAGEFLGSLLGNLIPVPGASMVGKALGGFAGGKIGTLMGIGDYEVKENSLVPALRGNSLVRGSSQNEVPHMHSDKDGTRLTKREYIGQVIAAAVAGSYKVTYYTIQPGLASTFLWGSGIADKYQEYKIHGMDFMFRSNTGLISGANPGLGMVMMATDYNAANVGSFPNKMTLENQALSNGRNTTESFHHLIECDPGLNTGASRQLQTRAGAVPAGQDPRLYDFATFAIATQGQPVPNQDCGELWVEYDIEFLKSTMRNQVNGMVPTDLFNTTPSGVNMLAAGSADPQNSLGGFLSANSYFFPPNTAQGVYQLTCIAKMAIASSMTWSFIPGATVTLVPGGLDPAATSVQAPAIGVNTTISIFTALVQVTGNNASFALNLAGTPVTSTVFTLTTYDAEVEAA